MATRDKSTKEEELCQAKNLPWLCCTSGNPAGEGTKLLPQKEQIKVKGPWQIWSIPVSFLCFSQSEILSPTLSLFLGGARKKF